MNPFKYQQRKTDEENDGAKRNNPPFEMYLFIYVDSNP